MKAPRLATWLMAVVAATGFLVTAGPASAQSRSGNERYTIIETSPNGGPVIARGTFTAVGTDIEGPNNNGTGTSQFVFPNGTITATHTDTSDSGSFNPRSCVAHFSFSGTYLITSGTGAYAGVTGSGAYHGHGTAIGCSDNASQVVVIQAKGPISF